jgi:hypothetical protein
MNSLYQHPAFVLDPFTLEADSSEFTVLYKDGIQNTTMKTPVTYRRYDRKIHAFPISKMLFPMEKTMEMNPPILDVHPS